MYLNKGLGTVLLQREIRQLEAHCQRCSREAGKLSSFSLAGMEGQAARALANNVHLQAAVARAHLSFCQSLLFADRRHLSLVEALPTTSDGVLDTSVAEDRMRSAREERARLIRQQESLIHATYSQSLSTTWANLPTSVPTNPLSMPFEQLIRAQEAIIEQNELILERAEAYQREVAAIYREVGTASLFASTRSALGFTSGKGLGGSEWMVQTAFTARLNAQHMDAERPVPKSLQQQFLDGDLSIEGSLLSAEDRGTVNVFGADVEGWLGGGLVGWSASLVPYGKGKQDVSKATSSAMLGVEAKAEVYGVQGNTGMSYGYAKVDATSSTLVGAVSGVLGASLFSDGSLDPSFSAKGEANATFLKNEATGKFGTDDYNLHGKAKGEVFTASAEAGASFGTKGLEAKAGAEAYMATGEISGGLTLFGVKLDMSLEAKAGGAGGKARLGVGDTAVEGELDLGLGLGLGVKARIDWSQAVGALCRAYEEGEEQDV